MYVHTNPGRTGYDRDGQQVASGQFLIAFSSSDDFLPYTDPNTQGVRHFERLYCCVRKVVLKQCGHWMMGSARIGQFSFGVSGGFGHDGLPMQYSYRNPNWKPDSPREIAFSLNMTAEQIIEFKRRYLTPMPDDLLIKYWTSAGHNEVGPASAEISKWAGSNMAELRRDKNRGKKRDKIQLNNSQ